MSRGIQQRFMQQQVGRARKARPDFRPDEQPAPGANHLGNPDLSLIGKTGNEKESKRGSGQNQPDNQNS